VNAGHPAGFQAAAESRRQTQLAAISEVSKAITSILDQEKLLDEVVSLIHKRFGFPYVHLFTVKYGPRKIVYAAGSGRRSSTIDQQGLEYDIDDPQGLIPWVVLHGATRLVNDVTQEPLYRPSPLPPHDTRSELTIPLLFGGQVLGVLDLQSDAPGAFDEEDRFLLETLAENVSIALRNAQLYRSEVWRRQVAESMREVVGLLSADIDLDTVLNRILVELEKALPLDLAAIWLVDEEELDDRAPQPASLHLAAVHGASLASLEGELSSAPPLAWLVEALDAGHPVLRTAGSPFDPLAAVLDFPPGHSAVAAPLKVGEISFGVLTLAHRSAGRYGAEASAMAGTFASYAAVAIENTRLYEDAHEQAWVSTVLLQVTEATQALTDLNELLNTVTQITPQLTGVKACSLYITDEEGVFLPAAASGLDERQQAEFSRGRFAPGDVRALDQMADLKQARILQWDEDNLRLTRIYHPPGPGNQPLEPELVVLVPLLAHGDVLGALLVEYQPETIDGNPLRSLDSFLDERLAVIQGIAHQTATAVENIRLVRAQREEAYASIALLQVAQAVVGSADLAEALGAVVRITPILVGVNRAVVFLSDQSGKGFRSIAAYGASREAVVYEYASGEFPLLDAVSEADSLVVYPLRSGEDIFKDVPDDWSFLIPPDSEEIADFLVYADRLLLACPLSVKGQVLGVLLVEEPELVIADAFSLRSNRRLRDKRLEILRGVSQQAALAIQNDILQRETVDRERLEREFQLARQIQRTFLPATIPNLEGWDLRVCWRTAREVGGDFYDFFELPGGRFGLVIADVADKGMPAALFMTVVRSLVRAAIHQADSPAKVLELVNHLIVPDATQGMFITLAYAVLDLESGSMDYANAGHNPPLVVRERTCAIERFTRGGMALGVLEDNPIQGGGTQLGPGDYLVMYTDGVTEAFSPMGEIYGEDKLYATVAGAAACADPHLNNDAQYLLEAIDQDVSEFIADAPRSDDLTLMVLRRLR
jgi:sigma-B regulation protein RsbU (phosphoserine phosphatase)